MPFEFEIPLSEDPTKIRDASKEELVTELRKLALADPTKIISRNYFRVHSKYSESAWSVFFGTFAEFKRQSGIVLTRDQHKLEREVAKHASVDGRRQLTAEKLGYEDRYRRPCAKRFQTVLVGSDFHDRECDAFWLHCFVETARRVQPELIVLLGDLFDLPEFGKYTVDPREWDVVGRIHAAHAILRELRDACPDAQISLVEGNHEARLLRHLADATPALKAVLADLHGWTVAKLLGLDRFEVNLIARSDLATFRETDLKKEIARNYLVHEDALLFHHFPEGRHKHMPGCNGHHHRHEVWSDWTPAFGPMQWHQLGCGHRLHATYCDPAKWNLGFALVHLDTVTKRSSWDYIDLGAGDHCVIGGRWYVRSEFESGRDRDIGGRETPETIMTEPMPPYVHTSTTSRDAAVTIKPDAATLRAQVHAYIRGCGDRGATDEEIATALRMDGNTERPRRVELEKQNSIRNSGRTRPTRSRRQAVVWVC